jgi:SagB-type dehydrogenase family enzyme
MSLEETLWKRRSVREFKGRGLTLAEIGQLLWAAQGMSAAGYRTAPSAGALYPLEVFLVLGPTGEIPAGVYRYGVEGHELTLALEGDKRPELAQVALWQSAVLDAPAVVAFCGVFTRTTEKYGERGIRYVFMEVGHAAENLALQAVALGFGTVMVGAFRDSGVKRVLGLAPEEEPLYLVPVGGQ